MDAWQDFFNSQQAASAALTGLIFVGISLNLTKILSSSALTDRAGQALIQLMTILLISMVQLIPDQTFQSFGRSVLQYSVVASALILFLDIRMIRKSEPEAYRKNVLNLFLNLPPMIFYILGGLTLLSGDEAGMNHVVNAFTWSYIKSVVDAWVLSVEINR